MSAFSLTTKILFVFTPLALTALFFAGVLWWRCRNLAPSADGARRVLYAAVQGTMARREWGTAMLAELDRVQGFRARWRFALGCLDAILFPPMGDGRFGAMSVVRRVVSGCGVLSVIIPPLGLPLLLVSEFVANAFTHSDDFFNGELVPGLVGSLILFSFTCVLAGIPLGLVGLLRREQRWLSVLGPISSIALVGYLMAMQYIGMNSLS